MKKKLFLLLSFISLTASADLSGNGLYDYQGRPLTTNLDTGIRNPLDVELMFGGSIVDARARTWALSSVTDSCSVVQSTSPWVVSGTVAATQSGTWTVQQGTPPWTVSQSGTWNVGLSAGSNLVGKVGIDQTTPGTTNGVQVNAALPVGTNSIGQVTANAGTNLNTSLLALDSTVAKDASLGTLNTSVNTLLKPASTLAAVTTLGSITSALPAGSNIIGNVRIDQTTPGTTNGVVVNSSALPSGAASATNQATEIASLSSIDGKLTTSNTNTGTTATNTGTINTTLGTNLPRNLAQVNGVAVNVGIGAASTGTQRVAVANDSKIIPWDGTTNATIKAASTLPALTDTATVITQRPDNYGTVVQSSVSCGTGSTTLLAANTATMFLSIRNPTTVTQTIWINVTGSAAVAAAPSMDIPPGGEVYFSADGASWLPSQQINCISGGTASTVTLVYR